MTRESTSASGAELPDLAALLAPRLQSLPPEEQPLLVAMAERMAAERYRGWAERLPDDDRRRRLLACANREETIAGHVEALHPDAAAVQRRIREQHPDLEELNRALFADRPLAEQLTLQARGERLGASTWRAFARRQTSPEVRETFETCAGLEEESAAVLESILADGL